MIGLVSGLLQGYVDTVTGHASAPLQAYVHAGSAAPVEEENGSNNAQNVGRHCQRKTVTQVLPRFLPEIIFQFSHEHCVLDQGEHGCNAKTIY